MSERTYARREAMRSNRVNRNLTPGRITQWDFARQAEGSILCSGSDAPYLGSTLIPQLVARFPRDHRTTVLLTGSGQRMQQVRELVARGMPAIYFDNTNRNYHAMFRQSASAIRQQIHDIAKRTMNGSSLDDLMRFLSVIITLAGHYYPLSLQSVSALLQLPHGDIVQLGRDTRLSPDLIDILNRSSDTCQDLRDILDSAGYALSGISGGEVENGVSLQTAAARGVPMIVLWQMGLDQETLNRALAEDLRAALIANPGIRVIIDSVTFESAEDPLLRLLMENNLRGALELVVISTSAAAMLKDDNNIRYFPNIFISAHSTPTDTERHTAVYGDYNHSEEHLGVHDRRFGQIRMHRQWTVGETRELRIRYNDLQPPAGLFGIPEANISCRIGQNLYLVNRNFFFRQ